MSTLVPKLAVSSGFIAVTDGPHPNILQYRNRSRRALTSHSRRLRLPHPHHLAFRVPNKASGENCVKRRKTWGKFRRARGVPRHGELQLWIRKHFAQLSALHRRRRPRAIGLFDGLVRQIREHCAEPQTVHRAERFQCLRTGIKAFAWNTVGDHDLVLLRHEVKIDAALAPPGERRKLCLLCQMFCPDKDVGAPAGIAQQTQR